MILNELVMVKRADTGGEKEESILWALISKETKLFLVVYQTVFKRRRWY